MGILNRFNPASSAISRFKDLYIELYELLVNFSYRELRLSDEIAQQKIIILFEELKEVSKSMNNPFDESFNIYTNSSNSFKVKISVGTSLILMHLLINNYTDEYRHKITANIFNMTLNDANEISNDYNKRNLYINKIFNN